MWTADKNFPAKGFSTPPPTWNSKRSHPAMPCSERKRTSPQSEADLFHVIHKVPAGDSPYVRAKHVQLVDKDPSRAISMFWAAINSGDRVDSALKDMAVVMKQLNRSEEAIEAIKSFRHLCPLESQESLDNLLLELYKRSGRIEEQIEMLQVKLKHIEEGISFGGKRTKVARSQGKKIQITIEQEYSRLLGNLAWSYLQLRNYKLAEELYRKALSLEQDKNKQCNLAICLMHKNMMTEAKFLLQSIRYSSENGQMDESYAKSYERAVQMMSELESQQVLKSEGGKEPQRKADFECKRNDYASPVSAGRIPRVPFTQPRRSSWSVNNGAQRKGWVQEDPVVGCNRKLLFEQPKSERNLLMPNQNRDVKLPPFTSEMSKGAHRVSENDALSINGNWRKPQLGNYDEGTNREFNLPTKSSMPETSSNGSNFTIDGVRIEQLKEDLKVAQEFKSQSNNIKENADEAKGFLMSKIKKSWADMVEEDEQEELLSRGNDFYSNNFVYPSQESLFFGQIPSQICYGEESGDENADCNIICGTPSPPNQIDGLNQKISSLGLKDGYYTQPENADSTMNNTNQGARRSLCFDEQEKKALNFDGHNDNSPLSNVKSGSGNSKSRRRKRLPVFEDITPF